MSKRTIFSLLAVVALVGFVSAPAAAQATSSEKPAIQAGISFLHDSTGEQTGTGFAVAVVHNVKMMSKSAIGVVGDLGYNHFGCDESVAGVDCSGFNNLTLMGGGRWTGMYNPKVKPFAQFLLGLNHSSASNCEGDSCSSNDFVVGPGVGVDVPINPQFDFHAQVDFLFINTDFETTKAQRYWFGISFVPGRK